MVRVLKCTRADLTCGCNTFETHCSVLSEEATTLTKELLKIDFVHCRPNMNMMHSKTPFCNWYVICIRICDRMWKEFIKSTLNKWLFQSKLSAFYSFHKYDLRLLAHTSQLLFDSRQMEVSAQQEHSRLSDQLNAVQQLQPTTGHRFSSQTLCCLFSTWQLQGSGAVNQSCGKEGRNSAVVQRRERERHPTVSFHCPLWMFLRSQRVPALKNYI